MPYFNLYGPVNINCSVKAGNKSEAWKIFQDYILFLGLGIDEKDILDVDIKWARNKDDIDEGEIINRQ